MKKHFLLTVLFFYCFSFALEGARLKDITMLRGARENQLMGYGLVVGLSGTGDRASDFTEGSLGMLLKTIGVDHKLPKLESRNAAAVMVTALIPAFSKLGEHFDVSVSSIGSATSLDGGTLMMTALKAPDGRVYAVSQGRIIMPKRAERGGVPNILPLVSAQIPGGAILEKEVPFDFANLHELHYQLLHPDFTTAARISQKVNEELSGKYATATDAGNIDVIIPYGFEGSPVDLVARIESLDVETDQKAKVVLNRKSGALVLGEHVKIHPAAVAYNNLRIQIKDEGREPSTALASPPDPQPATPEQALNPLVQTRVQKKVQFPSKGTSIADIVTSLNEVGAGPEDMVFFVQALKSAGALDAELELE